MLADDWEDDTAYSHVYIDIWQSMSSSRCLPDMLHICKRLPTCRWFSWWTMEMTFIEWFIDKYRLHVDNVRPEHWQAFCDELPFEIDLPADMDMDWYVKLCATVTRNAYYD